MADDAPYQRLRFVPLAPPPERWADMLMAARGMDEIRDAARLLGISFEAAYRERARLYRTRYGV